MAVLRYPFGMAAPVFRSFTHLRSSALVKKGESHLHHWHELVMVLDGEYAIETDGAKITSRPGSIIYYRSGQKHAWRTHGRQPIEYYLLQFDTAEPLVSDGAAFNVADEQGLFLRLFRMLENLAARNESQDLIAAYLQVIVHEFRSAAAKSPGDWLARVRSFVFSRLEKQIRLNDLARAAGLSAFHFSRRFRQECRMSPMQFVRRIRADVAVSLLKGTDLPHKAIARDVGLTNERDLYRLCMAMEKKTPSAIRGRNGAT